MTTHNRDGRKAYDEDDRTGNPKTENQENRKLPDNRSDSDENMSPVADTTNGYASRTSFRDDDIDSQDNQRRY